MDGCDRGDGGGFASGVGATPVSVASRPEKVTVAQGWVVLSACSAARRVRSAWMRSLLR